MWDDPAVANTGSIAKMFQSKADAAKFSTGRVTPFLTWRFCYLICGLFFGVARLVGGWPGNLNGQGDKYKAFLEKQLPNSVDPKRFDNLVSFLTYEEHAVWITTCASVCLLGASMITALPGFAIPKAKLSRRLLWTGWLAAFLPPFLLFLVFPIRSVADWEGVVADVCASSVTSTLNLPFSGENLRRTLVAANEMELLPDGFLGVLEDRKSWCEEQGADWHTSFYDVTVGCAWLLEDNCREFFCSQQNANLNQCLPDCLAYASGQGSGVRGRLQEGFQSCVDRSTPFTLGPPPMSFQQMGSGGLSREGIVSLYRSAVYTERRSLVEASDALTLASLQAEYIVGTLIALVAGRYLVPSSLSLLGGLAEALLNNKAMFPGSQHGAWILILTTCEVVPIYAALLAMFQQLVGDAVLAVACVMATFYGSLGIFTGLRILGIHTGDEERERLYKRIWFEYALRVLCGVGMLGALIAWLAEKHDGLRDYFQNELLTPEVLVLAIVDIFSKKVMTAICGTDFVLSAFLQTELWQDAMSLEAKDTHKAEVREVYLLMNNEMPAITVSSVGGGNAAIIGSADA